MARTMPKWSIGASAPPWCALACAGAGAWELAQNGQLRRPSSSTPNTTSLQGHVVLICACWLCFSSACLRLPGSKNSPV